MSEFFFGVDRCRQLAAGLFAFALLSACQPDADRAANSAAANARGRVPAMPSFDRLIEGAGPAVVNVVAAGTVDEGDSFGPDFRDDPHLDFFRRFAPQLPEGAPPLRGRSLGSGFVTTPDGYVITSAHLVAGSDEVIVRLPDGQRELPARIVGIDRRTDVALLKVDAHDLPVVKLGTSRHLRAGDWVAAIGSPFGFSNTITAGIVGATQRALPDESLVPFIQTDVAINPGNSGGPLLNLEGEVVGINSVIYSQTGGYMGVSFAVPIEVALEVSEQLRQEGRVTRGRIGVRIQALTEKLARSFGIPGTQGVLVAAVEPGGSAARAGLQPGDVMLTYDGVPLESVEHALRSVSASKPGTTASLQVWRHDERLNISVTVGEVPAEGPAAPGSESAAAEPRLVVTELPARERRELRVEYGLVVESVQGAAEGDLQPGDIIVAFNQTPITNRRQFDELLAGQEPGNTLALRVLRGLSPMYVPLRIPG